MADPTSETLRITSPCSHGIEHEFLELKDGVEFSTRRCTDSKGRPRSHKVTKEDYPETKRRR